MNSNFLGLPDILGDSYRFVKNTGHGLTAWYELDFSITSGSTRPRETQPA